MNLNDMRILEGSLKHLCDDFWDYYQNVVVKNTIARGKSLFEQMKLEIPESEREHTNLADLEVKAWQLSNTHEDLYAHDFRYLPETVHETIKYQALTPEIRARLYSAIKNFENGKEYEMIDAVNSPEPLHTSTMVMITVDVSETESFKKASQIIALTKGWLKLKEKELELALS